MYHQKPDFMAKVHRIKFRLGLPETPLAELTMLPQAP